MSAALLALALSLEGPDSGWVAGPDRVRLYYEKIGNGPTTIIVPGRLFLARDLAPLGERHTLILYDMRNRGRSSRVEDGDLLTIQKDVEDLEAVRRHFRAERFVPVGYSYLGFMVVLYAMSHPDYVERVVQLGPVPRKLGTEYPASQLPIDSVPVVDSAAAERIDSLERSGWAREHPKEFCEESPRVFEVRLVGAGRWPERAEKITSLERGPPR
jgi:pimeloyl-ACP methyl ester carboxylesterase